MVKEKDEKEVCVYIDQTISVTGKSIDPGDHIEARVNEENHALTIFSAQ